MKKLEKFINPSELFTSIFLLISITFTVIISLVIANRQEPQYGIREITTGHNLMESTLNLGEYDWTFNFFTNEVYFRKIWALFWTF